MIRMNTTNLRLERGGGEREKGCIGANSKGPTRNHTIQSAAQFTSTNILFFTLVTRMGVRRVAERNTVVAKRRAKTKSVHGVSKRSGGEEERKVAIAHRSEARGGVIVRGPDAIVCRGRVLRRERGPTVRAPIYAAASRASLLDVCEVRLGGAAA